MLIFSQRLLFIVYIPTFILCLRIIKITQKYTRNGAFFSIFFFSGISDIYHCAIYLWLHLVKLTYPCQLYVITSHFCAFFDMYLYIIHILCNFLMALNRFSATFMQYSTLWPPSYVKIYLFIILVISTISSYPAFTGDKTIKITEERAIIVEESEGLILQRIINAIYILIFESATILLTIATIYRLKNIQTTHEKKLIIVTAGHSVFSITILYYELATVLKFTDPISSFLGTYWMAISFGLLSCNFYTILIADSRIRQKLWTSRQEIEESRIFALTQQSSTNVV